MKKHYWITVVDSQKKEPVTRDTVALIRRCIQTALRMEGIDFTTMVTVTLVDDEAIHELNREQRGVDRATDVLSFPLLDWHDGIGAALEVWDRDPRNGAVLLGDVVISVEHVRAQAQEYGHSFDRECGYLTVHSIFHLLGYDHVDGEKRRRKMREKEENVLSALGLTRAEE